MTNTAPWYSGGLRFTCTQCGNCCRGEPGQVRASDDEVRTLAQHLDLDEPTFRERYTRQLPDGSNGLVERPDHACIFWRAEVGCAVYEARPRQCRTWPFWRANTTSRTHWAKAAETCPGIDAGDLVEADTIRRLAASDGTSDNRRHRS